METELIWFNASRIAEALAASDCSTMPDWYEYYHYKDKDKSEQHIFRLLDTSVATASCLINRQNIADVACSFQHTSAIPTQMLMPSLTTKLTWDEITYSRVMEIESMMRNNRQLIIRYSGGLDSTYIVCALLKYASKDLLNNTVIMLSTDSVLENPYFYKDVIVKNFKHFLNNKEESNYHLTDAVYVTGKLGDKILASDTGLKWVWENKEKAKYHYSKCKDSIVQAFYKHLHSKGAAVRYYELIDSSIVKSNLPIITAYDFFWWFSFNYAWVDYSFNTDYFYSTGNKRINNFPWFDTLDFQRWAMENIGSNLKFDLDTYDEKRVLKDFIYDIDKNEFDRKFKTKYRSDDSKTIITKHSFKLAVDANESTIISNRNTILADAMRLGIIPQQ